MKIIKRILRIIVGIPLSLIAIIIGGWLWLFDDNGKRGFCGDQDLIETPFYLATGQWDKMID